MSMRIAKNTLIVVADGETAKLFRNVSGAKINIKTDGAMSLGYLDDKGPSKLPVETSDKEKDEATFAKHIATNLYEKAHKGDYEHLILIADPQTLGQIRPNLHDEVVKRIVLEIPKTLTNSTIEDIEKTLASEIA